MAHYAMGAGVMGTWGNSVQGVWGTGGIGHMGLWTMGYRGMDNGGTGVWGVCP